MSSWEERMANRQRERLQRERISEFASAFGLSYDEAVGNIRRVLDAYGVEPDSRNICPEDGLLCKEFIWGTAVYLVCPNRHDRFMGITTVVFPDGWEATGVPPWDGPAWKEVAR
jgi:hypothetical protein